MQPWFLLILAVVSEVVGTSALKASDGFTKIAPSLLVVASFGAAFYFLA
ncbi:MAG: DMT family transporter, partial [Gammaproteobacteria bacterium]